MLCYALSSKRTSLLLPEFKKPACKYARGVQWGGTIKSILKSGSVYFWFSFLGTSNPCNTIYS